MNAELIRRKIQVGKSTLISVGTSLAVLVFVVPVALGIQGQLKDQQEKNSVQDQQIIAVKEMQLNAAKTEEAHKTDTDKRLDRMEQKIDRLLEKL